MDKRGRRKASRCVVQTIFYALTGSESQNPDQISSKWRNIRLKCMKFGGIYNNLQNILKNESNHFDVFKAALDQLEKTMLTRKAFSYQPLRRLVERNKAKKLGSTSTRSSVMDHFGEKFDRYVQVQENKGEIMSRVKKMIEAQTSFPEAQATLQTN
uniref:Uncharacterized protein n=1 Tax=Lactuca sativa TaxID=4236 RepID=A0A9R1W3S3_LACSA|nr:hypothetical protein LSAT_V11C300116910 [Lactuca sativa]